MPKSTYKPFNKLDKSERLQLNCYHKAIVLSFLILTMYLYLKHWTHTMSLNPAGWVSGLGSINKAQKKGKVHLTMSPFQFSKTQLGRSKSLRNKWY